MKKEAKSKRYIQLEAELTALRKQLLPRRFNPIGVYKPKVITQSVAFRVLTHAEIENYLEDRAWEVALSAINRMENLNEIGRVISSLIAFSGQTQELPPDSLAPPSNSPKQKDWMKKVELSAKAKSALNAFRYVIDNNNGIREKNILSLLLPIGIGTAQIDVIWLSTIDSFGKERGVVAHLSATNYRAQQQLDPKTELNTVKLILSGLLKLDTILNNMK